MTDPSERRTLTGRTLRTVAIVIAVLIALAEGQAPKEQHFSNRDGRTIKMEPSGTSFQIPADWDGLYVERSELEKVKTGRGEWYTEYAKVANAALPFADCSAQAGRYIWNASTFAGVTMRGYVLDPSAPELDTTIASNALAAAKALPSRTVRNASVTQSETEQWHRILISYDLWYGDYGGRANVDFYSTEVEGNRIVLVFMYAGMPGNPSPVQQVLKSFSKR